MICNIAFGSVVGWAVRLDNRWRPQRVAFGSESFVRATVIRASGTPVVAVESQVRNEQDVGKRRLGEHLVAVD